MQVVKDSDAELRPPTLDFRPIGKLPTKCFLSTVEEPRRCSGDATNLRRNARAECVERGKNLHRNARVQTRATGRNS